MTTIVAYVPRLQGVDVVLVKGDVARIKHGLLGAVILASSWTDFTKSMSSRIGTMSICPSTALSSLCLLKTDLSALIRVFGLTFRNPGARTSIKGHMIKICSNTVRFSSSQLCEPKSCRMNESLGWVHYLFFTRDLLPGIISIVFLP